MRSSNCRNCGKAIIWLKKNADDTRWNPPLDAESAQSGYCVVDDKVEFTYMYRKHDCTIGDIEAYARVQELKHQRYLESRAEQEPRPYQPAPVAQHVDLDTPAPQFVRPSKKQQAESQVHPDPETTQSEPEPGVVYVPAMIPVAPSHDWTEKPKDPDELLAWNYEPAIRVECTLCGAGVGEYCINRSQHNLKRGITERNKAPHRIRTEEAAKYLAELAQIQYEESLP